MSCRTFTWFFQLKVINIKAFLVKNNLQVCGVTCELPVNQKKIIICPCTHLVESNFYRKICVIVCFRRDIWIISALLLKDILLMHWSRSFRYSKNKIKIKRKILKESNLVPNNLSKWQHYNNNRYGHFFNTGNSILSSESNVCKIFTNPDLKNKQF